ncbi:hypothetical protein OC842_004196 [Tilletia horrida]|uniref:Uncharacterized protein n=1 Tax=Tilletia horrida TaxID=155126 RepID=A0AAN6GC56_9BASI|nr:hypothetical protein OC842_004196 [Tilletia horrida]
MAHEFNKPETYCRSMVTPGSGISDFRNPAPPMSGVGDDASIDLAAQSKFTKEQTAAEVDWVSMSKSRTHLPCQGLFDVLKRLGLKVVGWPGAARALLSQDAEFTKTLLSEEEVQAREARELARKGRPLDDPAAFAKQKSTANADPPSLLEITSGSLKT